MGRNLLRLISVALAVSAVSIATFAVDRSSPDYSRYIGSSVCRVFKNSNWKINTGQVFLGRPFMVPVRGDIVVNGFIEDAKNDKLKLMISEVIGVVKVSDVPEVVPPGFRAELSSIQSNGDTSLTYKKGYMWDSPDDWSFHCVESR
jgi:hypothetical protein